MARSAARILRRVVTTGVLLAIPLAPTAAYAHSTVASDAPLVLKRARIVDAVGPAREGLWTVTARGRVIVRIDQGTAAAPPGARTIDLAPSSPANAASSTGRISATVPCA